MLTGLFRSRKSLSPIESICPSLWHIDMADSGSQPSVSPTYETILLSTRLFLSVLDELGSASPCSMWLVPMVANYGEYFYKQKRK